MNTKVTIAGVEFKNPVNGGLRDFWLRGRSFLNLWI